MKRYLYSFFILCFSFGFFVPSFVQAHEVYVLTTDEISTAMASSMPDFLEIIKDNISQLIAWGILSAFIIFVIFLISNITFLQKITAPIWRVLKICSPAIAQFSLGVALFAGGYYKAAFGIELPFPMLFGMESVLFSYIFMLIGIMLVLGIFPRIASLGVLLIFAVLVVEKGTYMINYATYLGEALSLLIFGGAYTMFRLSKKDSVFTGNLIKSAHAYKFIIMRVFFGSALIYASLYAKFFHGALALETISKYHLTNYFPFDPSFLMLGAMIIEIVIGVFFIIGFEIRFTSLFFLTFLTMSLVFFGESVWPHIILIGTAIATFCHGYDEYTISMWLQKKFRKNSEIEPVF